MTWVEHQRRNEALRSVIEVADRRLDGLLPWDEVPDATRVFGTPTTLLRALSMRWHTRLSGSIDRALATEPMDPESAVAHAWRRTAAAMPGVRAILDANSDHPALTTATRNDRVALAFAAGLAGLDDPRAVHLGVRLEERARSVRIQTAPSAQLRPRPAGLVRRLIASFERAA